MNYFENSEDVEREKIENRVRLRVSFKKLIRFVCFRLRWSINPQISPKNFAKNLLQIFIEMNDCTIWFSNDNIKPFPLKQSYCHKSKISNPVCDRYRGKNWDVII